MSIVTLHITANATLVVERPHCYGMQNKKPRAAVKAVGAYKAS